MRRLPWRRPRRSWSGTRYRGPFSKLPRPPNVRYAAGRPQRPVGGLNETGGRQTVGGRYAEYRCLRRVAHSVLGFAARPVTRVYFSRRTYVEKIIIDFDDG